jgi:hypothetical protein
MGEFLRKWVSRRLLKLNSNDTARVMTAMRQFGNGTSGGTEAMAIFQQLLYDSWREGELTRPLARLKIDETNCFGMLEWQSIRKAARDALPRHYAVASWKHLSTSQVEQPGITPAPKDRGAEQGDVDGPLECSLTLGKVASEARYEVHSAQRLGNLPWATDAGEDVRAAEVEYDQRRVQTTAWESTSPALRRDGGGAGPILTDPRFEVQAWGGIADDWYLDDGDVLCDPRLVVPFLQCYDAADARVGGARNRAKTKVLYLTDTDTLEANAVAWRLPEVRMLAAVGTIEDAEPTLGVVTGPLAAVEEQLQQKVRVVKAMQSRVAICQDVLTEHILNRQSLGIGRINHILRVHGDELLRQGRSAEGFDHIMREAMDRLFPGLTPECFEQASLGAFVGGLGWRKASDVARPANLAALIQAEPKLRAMMATAVHAGLLHAGQLEVRLAAKIQRAESAYLIGLDEVERVKATDFLSQVKDASERQWQQIRGGQTSPVIVAPQANAAYIRDDDHHFGQVNAVHDGGRGDVEAAGRQLTIAHVQGELSRLHDCTRLRALESTLMRQGNWPQLERLKELRHPEVSHKWLWHVDPSEGSVMSQADYIVNVQKRLGARVHEGGAQCRLCGVQLDPQLEHAETCALAEATRGHYACVRALVDGFRLADPTVTTEARGLTTTQARPADILTTAAVPGRSAALDVCVASPNAAAAQGDAADAAFRRKLHFYRHIIPELARAGIVFRPLIWTADGRPHPAAVRTMRYAAERAAGRGSDEVTSSALLGRWRHEVMVAILRRRAAMTRSVQPAPSARSAWLLTGRVDGVTISVRAPQLDADDRSVGGDEQDELESDDGEASLHEGAN